MPFKDPEKKKEYMKEYNKQHNEKNKEKHKEYYENNIELLREKRKIYRESPAGKKLLTIHNWRNFGVIETEQYTYDELYETYLYCGYCELCDKKFPDTFDRCLDHDHDTGIFRWIVCRGCNTWVCDG
mgnify:CR=1 FL=1